MSHYSYPKSQIIPIVATNKPNQQKCASALTYEPLLALWSRSQTIKDQAKSNTEQTIKYNLQLRIEKHPKKKKKKKRAVVGIKKKKMVLEK
jgi:hypothetical protein